MRVFVALDVPETVKQRANELCTPLKVLCPDARWVRPEAMHLTLKFIGEVKEAKLEKVKVALGGAHIAKPLDLKFERIYLFPHRHPHTIVAGVEPRFQIHDLAEKVEWHLRPVGIQPERRDFHPHLTLARIEPRYKNSPLQEQLANFWGAEIGTGTTEEFHLYQSELKRGGAVYARLQTYRFVEPN